ncbi:MAG: general secretion pathway protein M [Brevundimonas sp.]|jgi:general secretion pathway protein M|uniref:type II secretion system protein GspM n=1 Tax=Brevundimonas sp. TaxID=1871086 RepID=UPI002487DF1F|nr:type II secretion system protein GspM [Brevundimonas sp.]MDI1282393.1 type II secretion system protein GspM [Brevundimonas sp.]
MTAFHLPLRPWWDGRTRREQGLLAVMLVILLALLLWLGVVRPAWTWRAAAADHRLQAISDRVRVEAGVRLLASPEAVVVTSPAGIQPVVVETAEAAGLTLTTAMDASGDLGFRASSASSAALFGWLADLRASHGIETIRLAVVENADATLAVEGALAPASGAR